MYQATLVLGKAAGTAYITFKYPSNAKVRVYDGTEELKKSSAGLYEVDAFLRTVYITVEYNGMHVSERSEIALPVPISVAPNAEYIQIENGAGIYADKVTYNASLPEGTILTLYYTGEDNNYVKVASEISDILSTECILEDNTILATDGGVIYMTATYPGFAESDKTALSYGEEALSMIVGSIRSDENDPRNITVYNIRKNDIIRVYKDAECTNLLGRKTNVADSVSFMLSSCDEGDTVYITNQSVDRTESAPVSYVLANLWNGHTQELDEEDYSKTYSVTVDFSDNSKKILSVTRLTGGSCLEVCLTDDTGQEVPMKRIMVDDQNGNYYVRKWFELEKPANTTENVFTYRITVVQAEYLNDTTYRIIAGDFEDAAKLVGGVDNAVSIKRYYSNYSEANPSRGGNLLFENHAPGTDRESSIFYKFTYQEDTVVTLGSNVGEFHFRIYEMDGEINLLYDSLRNSDNIRDNFTIYNFVTKVDLGEVDGLLMSSNKMYFLEVYCNTQVTMSELGESALKEASSYVLAIGEPIMLEGNSDIRCVRELQAVTLQKGSTSTVMIDFTDLPQTAMVSGVQAKDARVENSVSDLLDSVKHFRVRRIINSITDWILITNPYIAIEKFDPKVGRSTNILATGMWEIEVTGKLDSEITMQPGMRISYIYEMGD